MLKNSADKKEGPGVITAHRSQRTRSRNPITEGYDMNTSTKDNTNQDLKNFKAWLEENKERLAAYDLNHICNLAIACGYSRVIVAQWYVSQRFKGASNV